MSRVDQRLKSLMAEYHRRCAVAAGERQRQLKQEMYAADARRRQLKQEFMERRGGA